VTGGNHKGEMIFPKPSLIPCWGELEEDAATGAVQAEASEP